MVYRNNAGRLGSGFISVCLETRWLGQKSGFYFPDQYCSCLVCVTYYIKQWLAPHTVNITGLSRPALWIFNCQSKLMHRLVSKPRVNFFVFLACTKILLDLGWIFLEGWARCIRWPINKYTHTWRTHTHTHTPFCSLSLYHILMCRSSLFEIGCLWISNLFTHFWLLHCFPSCNHILSFLSCGLITIAVRGKSGRAHA